MALDSFKESGESSEVNETPENTDNTEKSRSQILDSPDSYDDDFDSKLDNSEKDQDNESRNDGQDKGDEAGGEKTSFLDRMKSLFSKNEGNEESDSADNKDDAEQKSAFDDRRNSFIDDLRTDAPSMEKQAETAENFSADTDTNTDEANERERSADDGGRTPGGDAWERRFGRVEIDDER